LVGLNQRLQLSIYLLFKTVHNFRMIKPSVWTFLCVKKLRTVPTCIHPDVSAAHPDDTQVRPTTGVLFKTQIWEDRCNRPDDVDSCPDALIHKASIAFEIQTSGHQPSWSGRTNYLYENCMHQINHPKDHSLGPDVRSLNMEIACSSSVTVLMTRQHRPDAA
jgi:hypothetical protein